MTWSTKAHLFVAAVLTASQAGAVRLHFGDASLGIRAELNTRAVATHSSAPAPIEIELTIPAVDLEDAEDGFQAIRVENLFPMDLAGKPELFTTGTLIAVPEGYEPRVQVREVEHRTIHDVLIRPAQRRFRCGGREGRADGFEFDAALYRSERDFPGDIVGLEEVGRLQTLRLMRVSLQPFRVNPRNRTLTITPRVKAEVTFERVSRHAPALKMGPTFFRMARAVTANARYLNEALTQSTTPEILLILAADNLKGELEPLVEWKRAKGLQVEVRTLSEAGGNRDAVLRFVQKYYDDATVKPTYLLFVGNKTTMPAFSESTGSGMAISDYRMSQLSGSDHIPDILYGRILADNPAEVRTQIRRMLQYEKSPLAGFWYTNGATIASDEGSSPSDADYADMAAEALMAYTYRAVDAFRQEDGNATARNISEALSEGRTWLAYWGHGSGTSWGNTNDRFSVREVDELSNRGRLPIVIDVACQNGNWGDISRPFGKAWVTAEDAGEPSGAVGFYGGSVNISWHPPAVMSVGVAKYHFEQPVHSLGGSVLAGQLYLVEKMGTGNNVIDNLKWYNLFGDPSLVIRTDVPQGYAVKHQVRQSQRGVLVEVRAEAAGSAVEGLLVSLSRPGGGPMAVGRTDSSGNAQLEVEGVSQLSPRTVLTLTGYNRETQQIVLP